MCCKYDFSSTAVASSGPSCSVFMRVSAISILEVDKKRYLQHFPSASSQAQIQAALEIVQKRRDRLIQDVGSSLVRLDVAHLWRPARPFNSSNPRACIAPQMSSAMTSKPACRRAAFAMSSASDSNSGWPANTRRRTRAVSSGSRRSISKFL
jgi:hypothetical protein